MKNQRLTLAAWQMLQRLGQVTASLQFSDHDGRFYFVIRGECMDLVRPSTIEALSTAGMIRRGREPAPVYVISDKGVAALRKRITANELDEEPVSQYLTVVSAETGNRF